jgi:hypothetical protein
LERRGSSPPVEQLLGVPDILKAVPTAGRKKEVSILVKLLAAIVVFVIVYLLLGLTTLNATLVIVIALIAAVIAFLAVDPVTSGRRGRI